MAFCFLEYGYFISRFGAIGGVLFLETPLVRPCRLDGAIHGADVP